MSSSEPLVPIAEEFRKQTAPDGASAEGVTRATGRATELIDKGVAAEAGGDVAQAENLFREAVALDPRSALACMNLGIALHARGEFSAAAEAHANAVRLDPALAHAHYNLALARFESHAFVQVEQGFREALRLRPEFPEAWVALAEVLEAGGRDQDALQSLENAIALRVGYAGALFNAGILLRRLGRLDEAEARLRSVPEDDPDYGNALTALAATLRDQARIDEAVVVARAAAERAPDLAVAQSELLFTLGFSARLSADDLFREHTRAGSRLEAVARPWCTSFENVPDPDRRLNVGYLSGDFRRHAVANFIEFLFEGHRRERVKVHAYSSTPQHDDMTGRFIAAADVWRDMREHSDADVAAAILGDRIDILVDLSGHLTPSRIGVLAGRAAPLQMTWLGYISTTGLTRIDYRISDPVADPVGVADALHTERLLRMPHSQWCFRPPPVTRDLPVARDASLRAFTFGAFNQFAEVSDATLALWIVVLRAVPAARLRAVGVPRGAATETLVRKLAQAKIEPARLDLLEGVPLADYFLQYAHVDVCLNTTPYSGGTTTCDALWMGVPVVTLTGTRSHSRSSASLLTTLGRADLLARSAAQFVAIATRLAAQGEWSTQGREGLRAQLIDSPLMDERRFTEDLEALYRQAWRTWCRTRRSCAAGPPAAEG